MPTVRTILLCLITAVTSLRAVDLPPAAPRAVSFSTDIRPLLETSCVQCHGHGKSKGGFSLENREKFLKGGDNGPSAEVGQSANSHVVALVAGVDPESVMPEKGKRWTPEQVGLLRAWIDQGAKWDDGFSFAKPEPQNLKVRQPAVPDGPEANPVDRLLSAYFQKHGAVLPPVVDDATFARRVFFDVIGLPPTRERLEKFLADASPDKRQKLVRELLSDQYGYADHWLSFWNDLLRNDYKGPGFIDGGRKQITGWLYSSLLTNKPFDQFVRELVDPVPTSEGFLKGIIWRGTTPAVMSPPMQAAQNVSQVFLGINLKCASCHDSFVSDWTLSDAYGLAAVFADKDLELVRCDKPTGKTASVRFLYPEVGGFDAKATRPERLKRVAQLLTSSQNGRLSRTVVNRLWARLLGRGLVEPLDEMDRAAWSADLIDWLAEDLVSHKYDLKHTLEVILTSRAYQLPIVWPKDEAEVRSKDFVFRGPLPRRLTAEQFADAIGTISQDWGRLPTSIEVDFSAHGTVGIRSPARWLWTDEPEALAIDRKIGEVAKSKAAEAKKLEAEAKKATEAKAKTAKDLEEKAKAAKTAATQFAEEMKRMKEEPNRSAEVAASPDMVPPAVRPVIRHTVAFRKTFTLDAVPEEATAAVLSSQKSAVYVNGKLAAVILADTAPLGVVTKPPAGRAGIVDLRPLLQKGENLIAISVESHTERPGTTAADSEKTATLSLHRNPRSGMAFHATIRPTRTAEPIYWTSDETWRARRAPDADWNTAKASDAKWLTVVTLAAGQEPIDEGVALNPAGKLPPKPTVMELGPRLHSLAAMTGRAGMIRSGLIASDALQVAMDRPNRDMVVSCRVTAATTIQALEMTNGGTLDNRLKRIATKVLPAVTEGRDTWVESMYVKLLARKPTPAEQRAATETLGEKPTAEQVSDLLWAFVMQPEFQFVR